MARRPMIRKSDLSPAFEAAIAAGYDQVTVTLETPDGRVQIVAGNKSESTVRDATPYGGWKASRAT
jgi:hypothetical protein